MFSIINLKPKLNNFLYCFKYISIAVVVLFSLFSLTHTSNVLAAGEFIEKVGPTVFSSAGAVFPSTITLNNGNVLIAYTDYDTGDGIFVIYDQDGNLVKSETVFGSASTSNLFVVLAVLANNNVLIAYIDSDTGYGTFVIYDQDGNQVKGPTVFTSAEALPWSATTLNNGNVLIAYMDGAFGDTGDGIFVIYDKDGNEVKGPTVFISAEALPWSATTLNNGNILIAYIDFDTFDGIFVIYDQDGNLVKSETVFGSVAVTEVSITPSSTLINGNVLIAYTDYDTGYGTFVIYDQDGNEVKGPTVFSSAEALPCSATTLNNGNILIAYMDALPGDGIFVIYDQDGNQVKGPTVFSSAEAILPSATTLNNGNVLIAYMDDLPGNGIFVIWGENNNPDTPSSLGPSEYTNGSSSTNTNPTLQFTQSDDDVADTVKYTIQIATDSVFSSKVVDYTSALIAQGSASFTVGQAAGSGTYALGNQGQTLSAGSYYWRVMSTDNSDADSDWALASAGKAFEVESVQCGGGIPYTPQLPEVPQLPNIPQIPEEVITERDDKIQEIKLKIEEILTRISQLQAKLNQIKGNDSVSGIPADFIFQNNLSIGIFHPDVVYLKLFLKNEFSDINWQGSNYFGPLTRTAVIRFQDKYKTEILSPLGLNEATGIVGPKTRAKINQLLGH